MSIQQSINSAIGTTAQLQGLKKIGEGVKETSAATKENVAATKENINVSKENLNVAKATTDYKQIQESLKNSYRPAYEEFMESMRGRISEPYKYFMSGMDKIDVKPGGTPNQLAAEVAQNSKTIKNNVDVQRQALRERRAFNDAQRKGGKK